MALTPRKRLVQELDRLFSTYIRTRDKRAFGGRCPFDCAKPIECCFHFVTRAKHSLRWEERNAVGACHGHNHRFEFDPHFGIQWYIRSFGQDAYDRLVQDGNKAAAFSMDELRAIKQRILAGIEGVCRAQKVFGSKAAIFFGPVVADLFLIVEVTTTHAGRIVT